MKNEERSGKKYQTKLVICKYKKMKKKSLLDATVRINAIKVIYIPMAINDNY